MGGLSIDGLVTGLDTTNVIKQLLDVERAPQRRLESRKAEIQKVIDAYQAVNAKFQTVRTTADELATATGWSARTATSSDDALVTASATPGAINTSLSFSIAGLAATHTLVSGSTVAGTTTVVADGSDITVNGVTITAADYGTGTLQEVVAAINDADAGVRATAVQVSAGNFRLQLTAESSGAAGTFTVGGSGLTAALGAFGIVSEGADATITVGTGPAAYQVTSASNTFTDVVPGVSFTVKALGDATITVEDDVEAIADKVAAFVTAMNEAQQSIASRSGYDAAAKKGRVFTGSSLPASLRNDLSRALIDPVLDSSLVGASVGIETDRTGTITFDRAAFIAAYEADPASVQSFFVANGSGTADDGIAERVSLMAEAATRLNTGRIATAVESRRTEIGTIENRIDDWDLRLEIREVALRRQFSTLETTLSRLQQQGQWLNGQLAGLLQ